MTLAALWQARVARACRGSCQAAGPAALVLALALVLGLTPTAHATDDASEPLIHVVPDPPTDSRPPTVHGRGFCPAPACSDVTLTLAGQVIATGVKVTADGSFAVQALMRAVPGQHELVATQTLADGTTSTASVVVVVPVLDYIESPAPPRDPDPQGASTAPPSPPEVVAPFDRPPTGVGRTTPTWLLPVMAVGAAILALLRWVIGR